MTVAVNDTIERYVISGTGPYAYSWRIFNDTDLQVYALSVASPPAPVLLTYPADYTVDGANDADGGFITLSAAAATTFAGYTVDIRSNTPQNQLTSIRNIARFLPEIHENAYDYLARQIQDLNRRVAGTIRFPDNMTNSGEMTPISAWLSKTLTIDANGALTPAAFTSSIITQLIIAGLLYPQTAAELAQGVAPTSNIWPEQDDRRYGNTFKTGSVRRKPTGFSWVTGNILNCDGPGRAVHDFNAENEFLATYRLESGTPSGQFWVDGVNGSDANTGGLNDPYKTIGACMSGASGLAIIWLMPGVYADRFDVRGTQNTISGGTAARAVRIKAWGGPGSVIYRMPGQQPGEMVWTITPAASTYDATPSGLEVAVHVIYHDNGKEIQIPWKSSAANANAVASGWFQDPGTKKIYIRHQNVNIALAGVADKFEIIYVSGNEHLCLGGKIYLEGVTFRGGSQLTCSTQTSGPNTYRAVFYARNCKWQYLGYHNFSSLGAITLLQDCVSEYSLGGDGFNYTDAGADVCQAAEIDCIGRKNGIPEYSAFDGDRNKQGSTGHNSAVILRVNGVYEGNYGQNIADTGVGSKSWMVGVICNDPWADLANTGLGGFQNLWVEGTTYLDSCRAGGRGSTYGLWKESGVAALYRCEFSGSVAASGSTTGTEKLFIPAA